MACYLAAVVVIVPLALILWHVLRQGLSGLTLDFFFHLPKPVGETGGGIANAIVGTALLVLLGTTVAVPFGVGAGLFLAEHGDGRFGTLVRTTADVLSGVPSIVIGVAAYGLVKLRVARGLVLPSSYARAVSAVYRDPAGSLNVPSIL